MTWYPPTVTVAAAAEPVTLDEAKDQCHVDGTDEDGRINRLVASARAYIEDYTGVITTSRTVAVKCDSFADFSHFPVVPLASVSSVSYVDGAGATQTLSTDVYEVRSDGLQASLALKTGQSWPSIQSGSRITVTAAVGGPVDDAVKQACLFLIGDWYRGRENTVLGTNQPTEMPHAVTSLLTNHRVFGF